MIKLNIVTPLTRPENLYTIGDSINNARYPIGDNVHIRWWVMKDPTCPVIENYVDFHEDFQFAEIIHGQANAPAGHKHRNTVLSLMENVAQEEYFYSLDDDNILHPDFLEHLLLSSENSDGLIGTQLHADGTVRLMSSPKGVYINNIDTAQFCIKFKLVNGRRFADRYDADGVFITDIYNADPKRFTVTDKAICYYNYLVNA